MAWTCIFELRFELSFIFMACIPAMSATTIVNITLVDGLSMNEGRIEYQKSDGTTWTSACGDGIGSRDALLICRHLGYPGVNAIVTQWPLGEGSALSQEHLNCNSNDESLFMCQFLPPSPSSLCASHGGVICYEIGYEGCFEYTGSAFGVLHNPCELGVQNLTIQKCISLCHSASNTYAGLYRGDTCLCGNTSTISTFFAPENRQEGLICYTPCTGRNIENCGGDQHVALFDNSNESTVSTLIATKSLTSTQRSDFPSSVSSFQPTRTSTEGMFPMSKETTSEVMTSAMRSRSRTPTDRPDRTTRDRTPGPTGEADNLGLYIGIGVGAAILLIIVIPLVVVFIRRCRQPNGKSSSDGRTILEMRSRPEGSELDVFPPASDNEYSVENGHTNMAVQGLDGVEDSEYSMIAETNRNMRNNVRNSSAYEDVPTVIITPDSRRPPQPAPRQSVREAQDASEIYSEADSSLVKNGQRDSFPEYAVSQKVREERPRQAVAEVSPSGLNQEDIAGLYTMPDKSKKSIKGMDNALYICRGDADGAMESSDYAVEKDDDDEEIEMVENELYTSNGRN